MILQPAGHGGVGEGRAGATDTRACPPRSRGGATTRAND